MELQKVKLSKIKPYPNNPRVNDAAVDAIVESIKQCGYCAPIVVDEDYVILAGHTRAKALKKLKWTECEVVVKTGLTEEQKRKYRLLDNRTNEFASWDIGKLATELDGLDFDGFDFGFDDMFNFDDETPEPEEPKPKGKAEVYQIVIDCVNEDDAEDKYNKIADMMIEARIETKKV